MPVLNWIGKDKVVNHDKELPFRVLKPVKELSVGENSENLLIEGDNLEALKALMPSYYGKVKCIYIDPPYNTGFEDWVYNDRVNSPQIKSWLNKVVGAEGEDLCRHDKWLCMMYPRLKLLKDLMREDGVIFVSIDDNEAHHLKLLMDEIFGEKNFIDNIIWKKRYGGGSKEKYLISVHEYVLFYAKNIENLPPIFVPTTDESIERYYKNKDEKFEKRGSYRTHPLEATKSMGERKNLVYGIPAPDGKMVMPKRQWLWSKERAYKAIETNDLVFMKNKNGEWTVHTKQYLKDEEGVTRSSKAFSIIDNVFTQHGTNEILNFFGDAHAFAFPKPTELIKQLISIGTVPNEEDIVLDSFAGSGTTGQAVLELNKADGGNRQFILVELEEKIAKYITSQRLKKVVEGAENNLFSEGTDQGFKYLDLNGELYNYTGYVNPDAKYEDMAAYIYFTETKKYVDLNSIKNPFIGLQGKTQYFLFFEGKGNNILDEKTIKKTDGYNGSKVVFADKCLLDQEYLTKHGITFKQIPYELKKY